MQYTCNIKDYHEILHCNLNLVHDTWPTTYDTAKWFHFSQRLTNNNLSASFGKLTVFVEAEIHHIKVQQSKGLLYITIFSVYLSCICLIME